MLKPFIRRVRRYFKPANLPLKMEGSEKKHSESARYISVYAYLACPTTTLYKKRTKGLRTFFAAQVRELQCRAPRLPIFLQEKLALRQGRFRHEPYVIVKLVVPENAIMGCEQGLIIKTTSICSETVHGCYLGWTTPEIYLNNPLYADHFA